MKASGL